MEKHEFKVASQQPIQVHDFTVCEITVSINYRIK